eukprot:gnl/TRDRNA2_/TRDRNA2_157451_c0_seq1.p1 gnl/TRDRNA2_/TRDRNA2_157451_c0~~gnl/TRDRNA2_/TRDRNA2_157451_c0_seq1.p1  ORF type:complete len:743 (+),score=88.25 gnl/TRDRNA2_/TRDRNA2_157451_c0_seq1:26-2230(+)
MQAAVNTAVATARGLQPVKVADGAVKYFSHKYFPNGFRMPSVQVEGQLSMFSHMFNRDQSMADLRRRALSLSDVIAERQANGPLKLRRIVAAFVFSWMHWYYLMPAFADWGLARWRREVSEGLTFAFAGGPGAEVSWAGAVLVTAGYLFLVFAGVRIMERYPPVKKRVFEYILVYNITQVVLNATLAFSLLKEAYRLGFPYPWGNSPDLSAEGHKLGMLLWYQYHLRQLDLVDTIFVVLRKKFHRLSFLHICLRLAHMWGWFFVCRHACGGDSYFPAAVNCSCQVLVYLYYALSLVSAQGVPLVRKARVTEVQVMQFVVCAVHAVYILIRGNIPRTLAAFNLFVMVSGLILYVDFDGDSPRLGPRGSTDYSSSNPQEGNDMPQRLTFCFDSSGWLYIYHWGVAMWLQEHLLPEGINTELANTDLYPKGLAFSGASGGSLAAGVLAMGLSVRDVFEVVLSQWNSCRLNPFKMLPAAEAAMRHFFPANGYLSMSGRVRVLLTRIMLRPPFVTAEVVDQFHDYDDVFHTLRASCHVPGLFICPYRHKGRSYYDGMMWSSMMVPWYCASDSLVVKVAAARVSNFCTGVKWPFDDISPPWTPIWWGILPPNPKVLRGLFWQAYWDAACWFSTPPNDSDCCKCRRNTPVPSHHLSSEAASGREAGDMLASSRAAKHRAAQKLLVRKLKPLDEALPVEDPVTGEKVADLIAAYRQCAEQAFRNMVLGVSITVAIMSALVFL